MPLSLWIYIVVGPLVWALMFGGYALARSRMVRLLSWNKPVKEPFPSVAVVMPAKDEGKGVATAVASILALDYPSLSVVCVDDRSTDETGTGLDQIAISDRRVSVIHVPPDGLPAGWLGKCHALYVGTRDVSADWILFVDSDVSVTPDALARTLSLATHRGYDAVSLLTRLECRGFWEALLLPLAAATWSVMFTVSLTNADHRKDKAYANGQFFLIRRAAYEAVGGHEAVKMDIVEDCGLMQKLKNAEFKTRLMMGSPFAATRMHATFKQMFSGWGRIYAGTARHRPARIVGAMVFILLCMLSVYPAIGWGISEALTRTDRRLLYAGVSHFGLMSIFLVMIYRQTGNRIANALLLPLSAPMILAFLAVSIQRCRTGTHEWRGTKIEQLKGI